jgi:hypothetical protein
VAAEAVTVAGIAALAEGRDAPQGPACSFATPFEYRHSLAEYLG